MIRVLLVDDHQLVRSGIRRILDDAADISVVGEAGSGEEAIQMARECRPDVVLMDVNMPGTSGIDATCQIHQRWPKTIIIGLSMHGKNGDAARAILDAGASAFVPKSEDSSQVIDTILRLFQDRS